MSLLTLEPKPQTFLDRFEQLRASLRRVQLWQGFGWTALAVTFGLLALVAADFRFELPRNARIGGLAVAGIAVLTVFASRVAARLQWWSKPRTAAEIERRFPILGQRIRTVVQYAGLSEESVHLEGVTPSLVNALEAETDIQSRPLPLDTFVPHRLVWVSLTLAALPALVLAILVATGEEWRIALARALLIERPYCTLSIHPGNVRVEEGQSVPVEVELNGRPQRSVVLQTRRDGQGDTPWSSAPLQSGPGLKLKATLDKVKHPLAYRITTASTTSPTYVVRVRYPLVIKSFEVTLTPPAYTGMKTETVKGGDLSALAGTVATFRIAFDAPLESASLVLTDPLPPKKGQTEPPPRVIPLHDGGSSFTAELPLTRSAIYRIDARTSDGRVLPKNRYKIEVRDDRAPRVAFDEPDEALEVHPIAEVKHRIRAGDDFGLTRAGIVFRLNDGEEQALITRDFATAPSKKSTTSAALEEMLLLEKLAASPTDSITYYGFAEDNDPAGPKRTETDLRYIDIRPFRREYKKGETGEEAGGQSTTLNELIARQRFNLNRANRLARRTPTDKSHAENPFKIAGFEETLIGLTREFTEGIEGVVGERVEPLHQAEEAMLASVEALDRGRNADAPKPMAEALRHLISARRTIQVFIAEDASAAQRVRNFDRSQAQKIRKDKNKNDEAEEIAESLEELAKEEDFVYATLAANAAPAPSDQPARAEEGEKGENAEKKAEKNASSKTDASKGSQGKGQEGKDESETATKDDPREIAAKQEKIVDELRAIEEKLKKLEELSELARARMEKAAAEAEKASNALARGNTKEATGSARAGAVMLHELARQVKGEVTREVADELAMARDLATELADREAELGKMPDGPPGNQDGSTPGKGATGPGGPGDPERLERLREAARTLEAWLKVASLRAEGDAAGQIRELVEENPVSRVVERMDRVGELIVAGRKPESRDEAREASRLLEVLAQKLEVLHRVIVAPEIATIVEIDKRLAELTESLKELKTDAEITAWHMKAAEMVRDLERAGMSDRAAELTQAMAAGGWSSAVSHWAWGAGPANYRAVPAGYVTVLHGLAVTIQDRLQNLILKDLASARDEATPPQFRALVERYYEVLSTGTGNK